MKGTVGLTLLLLLLLWLSTPSTTSSWQRQLILALDYLDWSDGVAVAASGGSSGEFLKAWSSRRSLTPVQFLRRPNPDVWRLVFLARCHEQVSLASSLTEYKSDAVLVVSDCLERLEEDLKALEVPAALFVTSWRQLAAGRLFRALTVRGRGEIRTCELQFEPPSAVRRPPCYHSAMGSELDVFTLPYSPFIDLGGCHDNDQAPPCQASGMSVDLLELASKEGNFTWTVAREPSGSWGSLPPVNGTLEDATGLLGRTLLRRTDIPLAPWTITSERARWVDFSLGFLTDRLNCFNDPSHFSYPDKMFLGRPLRRDAWLVTTGLAVLLTCAAWLVNGSGSREKTSRLLSLVGGLSFAAINAFYGGALTMFLASSGSAPFSSILEGLQKGGGWTLVFAKGDEAVFGLLFDMGDPRVREADRRYNSDRYREAQASTLKGTLLRMREVENSVLIATRSRVMSQLARMGGESLELSMFCEPRRHTLALMLPKNSPFVRTIDREIARLLEGGQLRQLMLRWFRSVVSQSHPGMFGISLEQMCLAGVAFLSACASALLTLCAEWLWRCASPPVQETYYFAPRHCCTCRCGGASDRNEAVDNSPVQAVT